ncbi:unconventional myosin 81F [Haematobia irritans]|uniref:unconventional myosin 81F n=1 Tax=Haematobia irritans TaxID=7368 RepID=UPI003F50B8D2
MDSSPETGVNDLTAIAEIDEIGINNNLKVRYENERIYTYTGSILIAVNPYKQMDIFSKEYVAKYYGQRLGNVEPHVFALAEASYRSLLDDDTNQSIVISGESGAGKTESTKFIIQYLCTVTSNVATWIQQQILEANTILEAFGNAKTVRNDNSSRFGKFMQICFDKSNGIKGCIIQDYLLEQSRITSQSTGERNYHVLYHLVAQGQYKPELMKEFHLKPPSFYKYLNEHNTDIEMESKKFEALTMAFTVLQISQSSIDGILKVLSAILWLGNLEFVDVDGERSDLQEEDKNICAIISELLGLQYDDLLQVLLKRQINVRGNVTEIPHKVHEARENRHSVSKTLYIKTFSWLVSRINNCTNPGMDNQRFLGVLDIFGFENFSKNSFEQLCINYTNEKLHKFFNHYVFALEQEIYQREEITYTFVDFQDNSLCLELIERPPRCIFKLLTEQCHMPKGSDTAYLNNMHTEFEQNPYYIKGNDKRHWETEFGIKHYAGDVIYTVDGFVEKNKNVQQDVLFDNMSRSENAFIRELSRFQETVTSSTIQRGTSKAKVTVSDHFRQQLLALIDVLQNSKVWYVRCIKPNGDKKPDSYDSDMVLDQLKYLGMLDIIRIRREGFPVHLTYSEFLSKYRCMLKIKALELTRQYIVDIMSKLDVSEKEWQSGKSKVFLRPKAYESLEEKRKAVINSNALIIQKNWKCYFQSKRYNRIRNAALKIQHAYRGWNLRIKFLRMRRAAIAIQSHLRGVYAREVAAALREMRRVDEEMKKKEKEKEKEKELQDALNSPDTGNPLEDCERIVKEEMRVLSHMAEQMSLMRYNALSPTLKCDESNGNLNYEALDLDNIFAFLSDVPSSNSDNAISAPNSCNNTVTIDGSDLAIESSVESSNGMLTCSEQTPGPPSPPDGQIDRMDNKPEKPEAIYECIKIDGIPHEDINDNSKGVASTCSSYNTKPALDNGSTDTGTPISDINLVESKQPMKATPHVHNDREQRRKYRVEKKIMEMNLRNIEAKKELHNSTAYYDIKEFAINYFNVHEKSIEGSSTDTFTRNSQIIPEQMSVDEMVTFLNSDKIPTSHIHLYDPENVVIARSIFRELWKYMTGDLNSDAELEALQYIIGLGIERDELRDEIFIQCMRQCTNNPNIEWADRLWLLMCLIIVAFQPSKLLFRYFVSFLKQNLETLEGKLKQYAQWCFDNCKCTKVSSRLLPPSSVEVAAMRRLGTIVCRFFFLDGRTKAIDVHPTDTAGDAVLKLADKLNLANTEGWAIYQSHPNGEEHIKSFDYLYDIIAAWEAKEFKMHFDTGTISRTLSGIPSNENRFVFKKRLFKSIRALSPDPVEVSLLYAQAVYSVVKRDEFPVSERVALQLAGLQAQVSLGDPSNQPKPEYYTHVYNFLPDRILKTREQQFWAPILSQAHRQYGASRNELTAKVLYLSCVMQYPLYGTTMFNVTYKGFWSCGNNMILGVNYEGLVYIQPDDKHILYQFKYSDIESILLDPSDCLITITLYRYVVLNKRPAKEVKEPFETQRCFVFETPQKNEIGTLIVSYHPPLSYWIMKNSNDLPKKVKKVKNMRNEDRGRFYQNIVLCRRQLIDLEIIRKPIDNGGGFLRNTLRRLSKQRIEKLRLDQSLYNIQDDSETYKGVPHSCWAFSKENISQCLTKMSDQDESVMMQIFQAISTYAGLGISGDAAQRAEDEHITIIQSIMSRCMRKETLVNELYLQLIKQTTDHPDPNSRINLKYWSLLSLACSFILPSVKAIRKYLISHLKRCASDYITEEGKYARFAEKCFFKTQGARRRQWPPSREEILCTINRRPCYAKFYFMDGQFYSVEFQPCSTALEVLEIIKNKIGLHENSTGYAIYEVVGGTERSLLFEEKITDILSKWEKYRNAAHQSNAVDPNVSASKLRHLHYFLFKKHLFLDNYLNLDDPVEKELLYHQVLHSLRSERFPITEMEAIMLTALQGQLELGDYSDEITDYEVVGSHCLPPRFVPNLPHEAVAIHHQSLRGMSSSEAKKLFLNLVKSWPLHRATIFDVKQSFTSNWPRILWLAVDQNGIHLLEHRSRNILCTHDYQSIISYSPNLNSLMVFTGTERKQSKVVLSTSQAFQIATLIKEYSEIVKSRKNMQNFS